MKHHILCMLMAITFLMSGCGRNSGSGSANGEWIEIGPVEVSNEYGCTDYDDADRLAENLYQYENIDKTLLSIKIGRAYYAANAINANNGRLFVKETNGHSVYQIKTNNKTYNVQMGYYATAAGEIFNAKIINDGIPLYFSIVE